MPIKFEIYRDGSRVTTFTPAGATAVGPESVPIPGEVIFKDGLLIVQRKDEHATGVSLLWDCGPLGAFQLETTRLQPRDKPYNLNVELARFRLMRIMQKQEDWNLFDFPKADKFTARFGEAQSLFAEALGKLHEPAEAAMVADHALAIGLDLSEQLAAFHSELLLSRRRATNGFVKHMFGCRVDPAVQNEKYKEALAANFDYCVLPMSWKQLQPQENVFNTEALDEWVELLSKRRVPTIAGPLIRLDESGVPDWMVIWEHDFDMLREMAYDFVQRVVQRYRRAVAAWNVVGGVQTNSAFTLSFEQIIELTRLLVSQVKTLLPNARTLITVTHPFGEYHARSKAGVPPMLYAEMVAQSGINFEAFALEVEMGLPKPGMFMRDLFQLSSMLDKFSTLGRPVFLTAIGCAGQATPDGGDTPEARLDPSAAGRWRKPWDAQLQADWMEAVYSMALSKPFIESVSWANLADLRQTLPGGGLLDDMLRPKPAFQRLQQMREKYKQFQKK
ncbi:MAG TPA: endo-1,4-beta-xylanase [Tepidisphaeraceae bacterium]|jgi:GH35 family endo-1,4-beta-xylanase|nr:endo-1,4-beta-xylanase [Tepidisphaeraceae bacterium]